MADVQPMARAMDVARHLNISRATFYRIPWFRQRVVYVGPHSPRWAWSDVELYKSLKAQERAA